MANFKLESGLRIRVTILDRRRRQRVKHNNLLHSFVIPAVKYIYNSNESIVLPKIEKKFTEKCFQKLTRKLFKQ